MIEPVALDLSAEVSRSIVMLRRLLGEDVEITSDLKEDLDIVLADPGQVQQLLILGDIERDLGSEGEGAPVLLLVIVPRSRPATLSAIGRRPARLSPSTSATGR